MTNDNKSNYEEDEQVEDEYGSDWSKECGIEDDIVAYETAVGDNVLLTGMENEKTKQTQKLTIHHASQSLDWLLLEPLQLGLAALRMGKERKRR